MNGTTPQPNPGGSLWNASPKFTFLFGLSIGVAVFALIGFFALLARVEGASLTNSKTAKTNTNTTTTNTSGSAATTDTTPTAPVDVQVTDSDHSRGAKDAKVTVVEFSDLQCPFCGNFHPTMLQLMDEYEGKVRWVYKHFPLDSIHPNARPAAEASECAYDQGGDEKFWGFVDTIFSNQNKMNSAYYSQVAKDIGLKVSDFDSCVSSRKFQQKVEQQYQEGVTLGVGGTPTSFANGQPINGALPYAQVKTVVDSQLAAK